MEREKYLSLLGTRNGYCGCPEMGPLYEKRKEAGKLEAECTRLNKEVDLNEPRERDRAFLESYERATHDLKRASESYHVVLTRFVKERRVKLRLHNLERATAFEEVSPEIVRELLKKHNIITIHCSGCDQQIDIAD